MRWSESILARVRGTGLFSSRWPLVPLVGVAALGATACGDATGPVPLRVLDLQQPWETTTPSQVGADVGLLEMGLARADDNSRLTSLLVIKNGFLVVEEYFRGNHADSLNDVRSVTKSVVSTLVGIALEAGFIGGLDETLGQYLHPGVAVIDEEKQAITIRDLLTMTGGFLWNEDGGFGSYTDWIRSADHIEHVLSQPLANPPGTAFQYNSAGVHLLGVLLEQATGSTLPDFAEEYLFDPIGVRAPRWETLTRGFVNGGAGVDLRPRDLARFGQLFLQEGRSGETDVLSSEWVAEATRPRFTFRFAAGDGAVPQVTYGYLWWVSDTDQPAFFAWGFGGQFVYVVPSQQLVVVTTNEWRRMSLEGGPGPFEAATLDVIANFVVPAFSGN